MQHLCAQCTRPFTDQCTLTHHCPIHQAQCFQCLNCHHQPIRPPQQHLIRCLICTRRGHEEDMYYDYQCDSHICRFHFLKTDFNAAEIELPCGHKQDSNDILMFMTSYCMLCGRTLGNGKKLELGICVPCEKRGFQPAAEPIKQKQAIDPQVLKLAGQQQKPSQSIKPQPSIKPQQSIKQESRSAAQKQLNRALNQVKSEMMLLKQSLKVSQFTRNQIKQAINHAQRDTDCIICLEQFDLTNKKPMMVCLQQHLVCQPCLPSLANCPLCKQEIPKTKVVACRQRMKTIQLEMIISEKYQTKLQKCLLAQTAAQSTTLIKQPELMAKVQPKIQLKPRNISSEQSNSIQNMQSQHKQPSPLKLRENHRVPIAPKIPTTRHYKRGRMPSAQHNGSKKHKK